MHTLARVIKPKALHQLQVKCFPLVEHLACLSTRNQVMLGSGKIKVHQELVAQALNPFDDDLGVGRACAGDSACMQPDVLGPNAQRGNA